MYAHQCAVSAMGHTVGGLWGIYYSDTAMTVAAQTRNDPTINFDWGVASAFVSYPAGKSNFKYICLNCGGCSHAYHILLESGANLLPDEFVVVFLANRLLRNQMGGQVSGASVGDVYILCDHCSTKRRQTIPCGHIR